MRLELLQEFLVWADCSTVEEAAARVHISQSAMSKHLIALENEIGAKLINRERKNHLTDAGICLYNGLVEVLPRLEETIEHCKKIDARDWTSISVWDPFVFSGAMSILERMMYNFESTCTTPFKFDLKNEAYMTPPAAIESGIVDVAIDYVPSGQGYPLEHEDIHAFKLLREPLIMWCSREHPLASKDEITPKDLQNVPIMCSMKLEHPLYKSIGELCKQRGFYPIFHRFVPASAASFFYGEPKNCVYLVTQGMQGDNRFQSREDMVTRGFTDEDFAVDSYVLVRDNEENEAVGQFISYLTDNTTK